MLFVTVYDGVYISLDSCIFTVSYVIYDMDSCKTHWILVWYEGAGQIQVKPRQGEGHR